MLHATAKSWKTPHGMGGTDAKGHTAGGGGEFARQVLNWQTPATDSFRCRGGLRKNEEGLDQQARNWPTPKTITGGANSNRENRRRPGGQTAGADLQEAVQLWPTPKTPTGGSESRQAKARRGSGGADLPAVAVSFPPSPQGLTISPHGPSCSDHTRRLNPLFVEHLMGFPLGWTDCAALETGSFRSWLRTHTELFELISPSN
jgi:hypothetical protein